jgi:hypothetical protein
VRCSAIAGRRLPSAEALADSIEAVAAAEASTRRKSVADLLASSARDEAPLREPTPPGEAQPAVDRPAAARRDRGDDDGSSPQLLDPRRNYARLDRRRSDHRADAPPEPVLDLDPIIELRHPKAVPALHLSDAIEAKRPPSRWPGAALVVGGAAVLALWPRIGSYAARLGHSQAVTLGLAPRRLNAPAPAILVCRVGPPTAIAHEVPPPRWLFPAGSRAAADVGWYPPAGLVKRPACRSGTATMSSTGRTQRRRRRPVHLSPDHHRVTVSSTLLAFPLQLGRSRPRGRRRARHPAGAAPTRRGLAVGRVTVDGRVLGVTPHLRSRRRRAQVALKNGDLASSPGGA